MHRRQFMNTSATGAAALAATSFLGGAAFTAPACNPKNISAFLSTIIGMAQEVAVLLPRVGPTVSRLVKVAEAVDKAYKAGQFKDAATFFSNLTDIVNELVSAIGVDLSPQIKIALALINVGVRGVAALLKSQAENQPSIMASAVATDRAAVEKIKRLADESAIDKIYAASKP